MFRITADAAGAPMTPTKGPALLIHGMFSDPTDFYGRTDQLTAGLPVQLANEGYDVWVGCTRGRDYTLGYSESSVAPDPTQPNDYWNFSFEDIGKEDIVSMVDRIILERNKPDEGCSKVTLVTHGTGANSALVAAQDAAYSLQTKVGQIMSIAPCLNISLDEFWLPVRDLASIQAFYSALAQYNITNLFGG